MIATSYEFQETETRTYHERGHKKKGVPITFCSVCRGLHDKCMICRHPQDIKNLFPDLVAHCRYVRKTWEKLKKFRMLSTGCDAVDRECRRMFGPWLTLSTDELLGAVCLHLVRHFELLAVDAVSLIERNRIELQNSRREERFNRTLATIALRENLKERECVESV